MIGLIFSFASIFLLLFQIFLLLAAPHTRPATQEDNGQDYLRVCGVLIMLYSAEEFANESWWQEPRDKPAPSAPSSFFSSSSSSSELAGAPKVLQT